MLLTIFVFMQLMLITTLIQSFWNLRIIRIEMLVPLLRLLFLLVTACLLRMLGTPELLSVEEERVSEWASCFSILSSYLMFKQENSSIVICSQVPSLIYFWCTGGWFFQISWFVLGVLILYLCPDTEISKYYEFKLYSHGRGTCRLR